MTQRDNNLFTIYINNFYNFLFKYFNNIKFDNKNSKENIKLKINNLEHSSDFQTVWLLNMKRLYNEFKKRIMLPLSLSYDHRIIDGAEAARFCNDLKENLGKNFAYKLAI